MLDQRRRQDKWGGWLKIAKPNEHYKFDRTYSGKKFFAKMDFAKGGTIADDAVPRESKNIFITSRVNET